MHDVIVHNLYIELPISFAQISHSTLASGHRLALLAPAEGTLIARSDANGEDLDNFAGAGLYDR